MEQIRTILNDLSYGQLKTLFAKHLLWSKENNRIAGLPKWWDEPGTINIIGIRSNTEADFNFGKYNDFLIVLINKTLDRYNQVLMPVTVDPNRTKDGIAHLRQGVWNSYVVRPHKWASRTFPAIGTIQRWAVCQDLNVVEVCRTDGKGKIKLTETGHFGINIHDNGGYVDSSIACTVIQKDSDYLEKFLPMLYDLDTEKKVPVNHNNLTYCLINHVQLEAYLAKPIEKEERATACGQDMEEDKKGGAKEGVKAS
jgi:hypothetical protein